MLNIVSKSHNSTFNVPDTGALFAKRECCNIFTTTPRQNTIVNFTIYLHLSLNLFRLGANSQDIFYAFFHFNYKI